MFQLKLTEMNYRVCRSATSAKTAWLHAVTDISFLTKALIESLKHSDIYCIAAEVAGS